MYLRYATHGRYGGVRRFKSGMIVWKYLFWQPSLQICSNVISKGGSWYVHTVYSVMDKKDILDELKPRLSGFRRRMAPCRGGKDHTHTHRPLSPPPTTPYLTIGYEACKSAKRRGTSDYLLCEVKMEEGGGRRDRGRDAKGEEEEAGEAGLEVGWSVKLLPTSAPRNWSGPGQGALANFVYRQHASGVWSAYVVCTVTMDTAEPNISV